MQFAILHLYDRELRTGGSLQPHHKHICMAFFPTDLRAAKLVLLQTGSTLTSSKCFGVVGSPVQDAPHNTDQHAALATCISSQTLTYS